MSSMFIIRIKNVLLKLSVPLHIALLALVLFPHNSLAAATSTSQSVCFSGLQAYAAGEYKKALGIFRKASKKKDSCAQFQLAMMYLYGHGHIKDIKKAKYWLKKSASNGFRKASVQLEKL